MELLKLLKNVLFNIDPDPSRMPGCKLEAQEGLGLKDRWARGLPRPAMEYLQGKHRFIVDCAADDYLNAFNKTLHPNAPEEGVFFTAAQDSFSNLREITYALDIVTGKQIGRAHV